MKTCFKHQKYPSFPLSATNYFLHFAFAHPVVVCHKSLKSIKDALISTKKTNRNLLITNFPGTLNWNPGILSFNLKPDRNFGKFPGFQISESGTLNTIYASQKLHLNIANRGSQAPVEFCLEGPTMHLSCRKVMDEPANYCTWLHDDLCRSRRLLMHRFSTNKTQHAGIETHPTY